MLPTFDYKNYYYLYALCMISLVNKQWKKKIIGQSCVGKDSLKGKVSGRVEQAVGG